MKKRLGFSQFSLLQAAIFVLPLSGSLAVVGHVQAGATMDVVAVPQAEQRMTLSAHFQKVLKIELDKTLGRAWNSELWDYGLAVRISPLQSSPNPEDRQIANAAMGYIIKHLNTPFPLLPSPEDYMRDNAEVIARSCEAFELVDTAIHAIRDAKTVIDKDALIGMLEEAGFDARAMVARHAELTGQVADGSALLNAVRHHEEMRISMLYFSGAYTGRDMYIVQADEEAGPLLERLNPDYWPRETDASRQSMIEDAGFPRHGGEGPKGLIRSRIEILPEDAVIAQLKTPQGVGRARVDLANGLE